MAKLTAEKIAGGTATVNEELLSKAIRHAIYLERLKSSEVRRVLGFVNKKILPDLVAKFEKRLLEISGRRDFAYNPATLKRMQDAVTEFYLFLKQGMKQVKGDFKGSLQEIAKHESAFQSGLLQKSVEPFGVSTTFPSVRLLDKIANNTMVLGERTDKWFDSMAVKTRDAVSREINIGLSSGEGIDKIVRRITGTAANKYTDGILEATRRSIQTNVRTAINSVTTNAREEMYKENTDVISGVQYVATLDNRTTDICASLDGQVFPVGEGPRPPQHYGCRSQTIPVTRSWKSLGINLKEAPPGTRQSMNGQVPAKLTYPKWLRGQPNAVQDEVLGKGKAALFRSGQVGFSGFVDNKNQPLTLAQVRAREGIA